MVDENYAYQAHPVLFINDDTFTFHGRQNSCLPSPFVVGELNLCLPRHMCVGELKVCLPSWGNIGRQAFKCLGPTLPFM